MRRKKIKPVVTENYEFQYRHESKQTAVWKFRTIKKMMQGQNKGLFGQVIGYKCDASQSVLNGGNQACHYGGDECKHQYKL